MAERGDDRMLVRVEGVGLAFGGIQALAGVDAEIPRGEVTAVIGPNGAGKTSLLNALTGVSRREVTGRITLDQQRSERWSPVRVRRWGVSRSYQHPPFLERATVVENLLLGAHPELGYTVLDQLVRPWRMWAREREAADRVRTLLAEADLERWADRPASELPYGARKMADVIRAVVCEPRLLLLDEPTSGLDAGEQERVVRLLGRLAQRPELTVVLVEHHMDVVRRTAGHVLGMHMGQVIASGGAEEVLGSPSFRDAILGTSRPEAEQKEESHG